MKAKASIFFNLLIILILEIFVAWPAFAVVRIMPLGDSLTRGRSSEVSDPNYQISYRKELRDRLVAAGFDTDFVGSQDNGSAVFNDSQHEGHGGWTADQIRDNVYNWLNTHPADIILLHIGTNDISQSQDPTIIVSEVSQILDEIDRYESDRGIEAVVILALIINRWDYTCGSDSATTTFNDELNDMALARIDVGDRIEIVDIECMAGIDYREQPTGDMWDAIHPVGTGYEKMADGWFSTLSVILPTIVPSTCTLAPWFQETTLNEGVTYYTDRAYTLADVPNAYVGMNLIKTPNYDRNFTTSSDYLTFTMPDDGMVYVAFDSRAISLPNWMNGFIDTGDVLLTSLSTQPSLKIYSKDYATGACVNLGSNKGSGFSGDTVSNYIVFYLTGSNPAPCSLDNRFNMGVARVSEYLYTDRNYIITGGLPDWMVGRTMIQTPNDQRNNQSASGYVRFTNPMNWWVYVLFDSRSSSVPAWLNDWEWRSQYQIQTSLATQPYLKVYRKWFGAGQCVDLGGNYGSGSSGEYRSNYSVVYGK